MAPHQQHQQYQNHRTNMKCISKKSSILLVVTTVAALSCSFVNCFVVFPAFSTSSKLQQQQWRQNQRQTLDHIVMMSGASDDMDGLAGVSREMLEELTLTQLKQQLRLRGLKVGGKKSDLIDRLLSLSSSVPYEKSVLEPEIVSDPKSVKGDSQDDENDKGGKRRLTKEQILAAQKGKEFIDVTAYVDDEDKDKDFKSFTNSESSEDEEYDDFGNKASSNPETWGADARIVEDLESQSMVVDNLSRTIIDVIGANKTYTKAFVVASRDALIPFLAGGNRTGDPEKRLQEIQMKREKEAKRYFEDEEFVGADEGDEFGHYTHILERDYSDWGKYSITGAQLSAQEIQGVLLLSDVYGPFTGDTQILAEKIAFESQPIVVMAPDLFRGNPWKEDPNNPGFNEAGQNYEEWRATHPEARVNYDIRAAAACLRDAYHVNSVVVWGMCYGGGRALEVASGYIPDGSFHDLDGTVGPPPVDPMVAVAWYPTRYDVHKLFGPNHVCAKTDMKGEPRKFAVMGVFAGKDTLPGATYDDAAELKSLVGQDERIKDHLIKVFKNQDHGFAHIGISERLLGPDTETERFIDGEFGGSGRVRSDDSEAEMAYLLSSSFMEMYSRVFLPTAVSPICEEDSHWGKEIDMIDLSEANTRDIRQEIDDAIANYKPPEEQQGIMIDPSDEADQDKMAEYLRSRERKDTPEEYKIKPGDDIPTMYAKLLTVDKDFKLF